MTNQCNHSQTETGIDVDKTHSKLTSVLTCIFQNYDWRMKVLPVVDTSNLPSNFLAGNWIDEYLDLKTWCRTKLLASSTHRQQRFRKLTLTISGLFRKDLILTTACKYSSRRFCNDKKEFISRINKVSALKNFIRKYTNFIEVLTRVMRFHVKEFQAPYHMKLKKVKLLSLQARRIKHQPVIMHNTKSKQVDLCSEHFLQESNYSTCSAVSFCSNHLNVQTLVFRNRTDAYFKNKSLKSRTDQRKRSFLTWR